MQTEALGRATGDHSNNFDTLRLLAAVTVLFFHSVPLSYGPGATEIVSRLTGGHTPSGQIAVAVFFIISGYLITGSYERSAGPLDFVMARVLRLMPALAAFLGLLAFVLGPVMSDVSPERYFAGPAVYCFVTDNLTMRYATSVCIRRQPEPWRRWLSLDARIRGEVLHPRALLGFGWAAKSTLDFHALSLLSGLDGAFRVHFDLRPYRHLSRRRHDLRVAPRDAARYAVACGCLWLISLPTAATTIATATVGAYCVIYLATAPNIRLPNLARWGDLSYGIYIWAFPIQQTVTAMLGTAITWYWSIAISLPIAVLFALASWHIVEKPCQKFRRKHLLAPHARSLVSAL